MEIKQITTEKIIKPISVTKTNTSISSTIMPDSYSKELDLTKSTELGTKLGQNMAKAIKSKNDSEFIALISELLTYQNLDKNITTNILNNIVISFCNEFGKNDKDYGDWYGKSFAHTIMTHPKLNNEIVVAIRKMCSKDSCASSDFLAVDLFRAMNGNDINKIEMLINQINENTIIDVTDSYKHIAYGAKEIAANSKDKKYFEDTSGIFGFFKMVRDPDVKDFANRIETFVQGIMNQDHEGLTAEQRNQLVRERGKLLEKVVHLYIKAAPHYDINPEDIKQFKIEVFDTKRYVSNRPEIEHLKDPRRNEYQNTDNLEKWLSDLFKDHYNYINNNPRDLEKYEDFYKWLDKQDFE
ncbi:hypothetical protein IJ384_00010 [bacterium]|nr:hypothetical protein [bacterium]